MRTCAYLGCARPARKREWCNTHYAPSGAAMTGTAYVSGPRVQAYSRCWSCGDVKTKLARRAAATRGVLNWTCEACQVAWAGPNQPELAPKAR